MTNKIEFHPNPKQLWEEYHSVVAPVISLDGFDYERKYDEEPSYCKHPEDSWDSVHYITQEREFSVI